MGMKVKHKNYQLKLIDHMYNQIPAFTDLFNEETFYMTVVCIIIATIVVVLVVSRYVTLKPVD